MSIFTTEKKPLLVIVNPKSGTGHSMHLYKTLLRPALEENRHEHELLQTEFQGHAMDTVQHADLSKYSGIVTVSGDGIVFEVYNGLYRRKDWDNVAKFPVGVVPGGSGCALQCSILRHLHQPFDGLSNLGARSALKNVMAGCQSGSELLPIDILEVESCDGNRYASVLGVTIGVIADSDIGSEWLRCMGFMRSYLYIAWRTAFLTPCRARVSYVPLPLDEKGKPIALTSNDQKLQLPPLSEPLLAKQNWVTEEGYYHVVYALNLSTLDPFTVFAPESKVGDGIAWLVFVRGDISRLELIKWYMDLSQGPDTNSPHLDSIPIRAFRIEPLDLSTGIMSLDAESVTYGPIQGQVLPQKARVMAVDSNEN